MPVSAPDPLAVRVASRAELDRLGLPVPPQTFPLVWDGGDLVELRPRLDLERRAVILHTILEFTFGMPGDAAVSWLERNDLTPDVTDLEWAFLTTGLGDRRSFILHLDALGGLAWVLGIIDALDPLRPPQQLTALFPDLLQDESFVAWQGRTLTAPRDATVVAAALDLHYCLDWGYLKLDSQTVPGDIDANAIGQRRWALEWATVFTGPHHDPPGGWEEVDLSMS
jgi:Domain of unknown function (DUF4272)